MRIGVIESTQPFLASTDWAHFFAQQLEQGGHQVEHVVLPCRVDDDSLLQQAVAYRLMQFDTYFDRVVTVGALAHFVSHKRKISWVDEIPSSCILADSPSERRATALRAALQDAFWVALKEAQAVWVMSRSRAKELERIYGIMAPVLYPPVAYPELFRAGPYSSEVLCFGPSSRSRLRIVLDAMARVESDVTLKVYDYSLNPQLQWITHEIAERGLTEKVKVAVDISYNQRVKDLNECLAVLALDDEGVAIALEAAHARRPYIAWPTSVYRQELWHQSTHNCGEVQSDPCSLARALDRLEQDNSWVRSNGDELWRSLRDTTDWLTVVRALLA